MKLSPVKVRLLWGITRVAHLFELCLRIYPGEGNAIDAIFITISRFPGTHRD
jgi:hypothetical protein